MAELADAADSKSADRKVMGVRFPLPAPSNNATAMNGLQDSWCVRLGALALRSTGQRDRLRDHWQSPRQPKPRPYFS